MWIRKSKYEKLVKRIEELEGAVFMLRAPNGCGVGKITEMILDHLGLHVNRSFQYDRLLKKGGPERAD